MNTAVLDAPHEPLGNSSSDHGKDALGAISDSIHIARDAPSQPHGGSGNGGDKDDDALGALKDSIHIARDVHRDSRKKETLLDNTSTHGDALSGGIRDSIHVAKQLSRQYLDDSDDDDDDDDDDDGESSIELSWGGESESEYSYDDDDDDDPDDDDCDEFSGESFGSTIDVSNPAGGSCHRKDGKKEENKGRRTQRRHRCVTFSIPRASRHNPQHTHIFRYPRNTEDPVNVWWQRAELKETRRKCCKIAEQIRDYEDDYEMALETLADSFDKDNLVSEEHIHMSLRELFDLSMARGLERHISPTINSICEEHLKAVLDAQKELERTGTRHSVNGQSLLGTVAFDTSRRSRQLALKLAEYDVHEACRSVLGSWQKAQKVGSRCELGENYVGSERAQARTRPKYKFPAKQQKLGEL